MSIAQALGAMDPANADTYAANAAEGAAEVTALANQLVDRMRPLTGRPFVLPHDAFQYFERRFGLAATGAITLSDAAAPGPAHIRDLQSAIADAGVVCILRDHETDAGWIDLLIEGTEARSALIDGTGAALQSGPGAYVAMMEALGDAFANCLT